MDPLKMYFLLKMLIFHCYVSLPEGNYGRQDHGKVLLEGTHPTCHPVTKRVRQMILEGKIGPPAKKTHTNMKGFVELVGGGAGSRSWLVFLFMFVLVRPWLLFIVAACCLFLVVRKLMTLQPKGPVSHPDRRSTTKKTRFVHGFIGLLGSLS